MSIERAVALGLANLEEGIRVGDIDGFYENLLDTLADEGVERDTPVWDAAHNAFWRNAPA